LQGIEYNIIVNILGFCFGNFQNLEKLILKIGSMEPALQNIFRTFLDESGFFTVHVLTVVLVLQDSCWKVS
jgi:hypothetical protein